MTRPPSDEDFTELVHAAWPSLYRTAYLLLGDRAEAEDLVQSALAKTYASWGRVRSLEAGPGYARTTLVNTATSWFRRRSWRNERPTATLPDHGTVGSDPSDRPALVAALAQLPPRQRAVVVLRYYDDLSVAETASALAITEGTVKSQTSDALTKLRALLGDDVLPQTNGATR
ncbi:SigE family RNA polymerase sigma factor [Nocardioides sp. 1609]|uniref:SigE family RNA polymerase sigma factor n=1 Tax=Nocardioides sp. 1609 TaxID=2508327 RepID=UPI00106FAC62|nr:SigE family RNA polymerase sigma factor [Nocardioides sp. 1609]